MINEIGHHIVGVYKGTLSKAWANNANKFNHTVGLVVNEYVDEWGTTQSETLSIDMPYQEEDRVKAECQNLKQGNLVTIRVMVRLVTPKSGGKSFNAFSMIKGTSVRSLSEKGDVKQLKKASQVVE